MELADSVTSNQCSVISNRPSDLSQTLGGPPPPLNTDLLITDYRPLTLRELLKQHGRLPLSQCLAIGRQLASALAHLHARGLVHRDVKPSNIVFVNGVAKLADIGLVAEASEDHSFVGTEGVIPPEGPGTPQADLYSLGKVLYEISTGRDRHDFPALPDDLAEDEAMLELNAVILKTWKKDLGERYHSATELQSDLALLQSGRSVKRLRVVERRFAIGRKAGVAALVLILLGAGVYFLVATLNRRAATEQRLSPTELAAREGTGSLEAYKKYVQGRTAMRQRNRAGLKEGLKLMTEAVELDPRFLRAWSELFINYVHGRWKDSDPIAQERLIAKKLEELNANSAEAHFA